MRGEGPGTGWGMEPTQFEVLLPRVIMVNAFLLDIFSQLMCDQQMGAGSKLFMGPHVPACPSTIHRDTETFILTWMFVWLLEKDCVSFQSRGQVWFLFRCYQTFGVKETQGSLNWEFFSCDSNSPYVQHNPEPQCHLCVAKETKRTGKQDASAAHYAWADPVYTSWLVSMKLQQATSLAFFFFSHNDLEQGAFLEDPRTYRR